MCTSDGIHIYFKVHIWLVFGTCKGILRNVVNLTNLVSTFLQYICCFISMYIQLCIQNGVFHWNKPFKKLNCMTFEAKMSYYWEYGIFLYTKFVLVKRENTMWVLYDFFFHVLQLLMSNMCDLIWRGGHTCFKPPSRKWSLVSQGK